MGSEMCIRDSNNTLRQHRRVLPPASARFGRCTSTYPGGGRAPRIAQGTRWASSRSAMREALSIEAEATDLSRDSCSGLARPDDGVRKAVRR